MIRTFFTLPPVSFFAERDDFVRARFCVSGGMPLSCNFREDIGERISNGQTPVGAERTSRIPSRSISSGCLPNVVRSFGALPPIFS